MTHKIPLNHDCDLLEENIWIAQYIADIRRHAISAHHLNSYNFPNELPATASITGLEQRLFVKVLTFIF
jgi:hypothetical protein